MKRLYRSKNNKWLGGVVGGIAEYFNFEPSLLRIFLILAGFLFGLAGELVLAYILAWIILPSQYSTRESCDDEDKTSKKEIKPGSEVIIGGIIIVIGVAIFLRQLMPAEWLQINKQAFLAGILILAGLLILVRGKK